MARTTLFLIFTLLAQYAFADDNTGMAYFAMQHPKWPCDESLNVFEGVKVPKVAVLWNTFGTETACLKKFLDDPREKLIEIHLINEPCHRNKRCGSYEFLNGITLKEYSDKLAAKNPELLAHFKTYSKGAADLLRPYQGPKLHCYISPGLESNVRRAGAEVLISAAKELFPQCKIVWSPVGSNLSGLAPFEGVVQELHGSWANLTPPCIANLDGEDISFPERPAASPPFLLSSRIPEFKKKFASCDAAFLWIAEFNGLARGGFLDPRERTIFPTASLFGSLSRALSALSE